MSEAIYVSGICKPSTKKPIKWTCPECFHPISTQDRLALLDAVAEHDEQICPLRMPKVIA